MHFLQFTCLSIRQSLELREGDSSQSQLMLLYFFYVVMYAFFVLSVHVYSCIIIMFVLMYD